MDRNRHDEGAAMNDEPSPPFLHGDGEQSPILVVGSVGNNILLDVVGSVGRGKNILLEELVRQEFARCVADHDAKDRAVLDRLLVWEGLTTGNSAFDQIGSNLTILIDLFLPPDRAEVFETRWSERYGARTARLICCCHILTTVVAHHWNNITRAVGGLRKIFG
jgi:hypothetical protein